MAQDLKPATGSLARGLSLLEILRDRDEVKLAELPDLLGASRATAFRLLATLQEHGYVVHNKETRTYSLGAAAAALGARSRANTLVHAAENELQRLRDLTGETVNLAVLQGTRLVYIRILDGLHPLRMSGNAGDEAPIHATALGCAILAELPDERHEQFVGPEPFDRFTERTPGTRVELQRAVRQARSQRWALDDETMDRGAVCLGAAICQDGGDPVGGISISGAAARLNAAKRKEFGEAVAAAAERVGARLGVDDHVNMSLRDHRKM